MPNWNPDLYLRFEKERTRPALDLANAMITLMPEGQQNSDPTLLDLGCGPGNSTALLAQTLPEAEITGLDSSPDMIQRAEESGCKARWILADMST